MAGLETSWITLVLRNILFSNITFILIPLSLLCLSSILYYGFAIFSAVRFFSQPKSINLSTYPPVSILKPICGADHHTYENLASFCCQDYPNYQIIFGVRDFEDASVPLIRQLIQAFPQIDIQLVISDRSIGINPKVNRLAAAVQKAKHDILLLADSDVRVGADYLKSVVQPFSDASVGMVTCLYRSRAQGWVAAFEALGTSTDFIPSVLVARELEGVAFALGATIVLRRSTLNKIGGFGAIADYIGDDFMLGNLTAQLGYQVVLSSYVVEHVLSETTLSDCVHRQIRWLRNIRFSRFWGYLGLIFTQGTPMSLLLLLITRGSMLGWSFFAIVWTMRWTMAWLVGVQCLRESSTKRWLWMVPVRDVVNFALWCYGLFGDTVRWRDRSFKLTTGGKLVTPRLKEVLVSREL